MVILHLYKISYAAVEMRNVNGSVKQIPKSALIHEFKMYLE